MTRSSRNERLSSDHKPVVARSPKKRNLTGEKKSAEKKGKDLVGNCAYLVPHRGEPVGKQG